MFRSIAKKIMYLHAVRKSFSETLFQEWFPWSALLSYWETDDIGKRKLSWGWDCGSGGSGSKEAQNLWGRRIWLQRAKGAVFFFQKGKPHEMLNPYDGHDLLARFLVWWYYENVKAGIQMFAMIDRFIILMWRYICSQPADSN